MLIHTVRSGLAALAVLAMAGTAYADITVYTAGPAALIEKLAAENTHLTHAEVERVVNIVLGRMVDSLGDGGRVELRGFGAFSVRGRPARAGRNPRTGETVDVPAKAVPFFKSGKELRERLNAGDA